MSTPRSTAGAAGPWKTLSGELLISTDGQVDKSQWLQIIDIKKKNLGLQKNVLFESKAEFESKFNTKDDQL